MEKISHSQSDKLYKQGVTNPQLENREAEYKDIFRIKIKPKRIKSYRILHAVSNHNRIAANNQPCIWQGLQLIFANRYMTNVITDQSN